MDHSLGVTATRNVGTRSASQLDMNTDMEELEEDQDREDELERELVLVLSDWNRWLAEQRTVRAKAVASRRAAT